MKTKKRQNKKGKPKKKFIFIILTLLFIIIFFLNSSYFEVKEIEVLGVSQILPLKVVKLSSLQPLQNILYFRTQKVKENIFKHPKVKNVEIKRIFPNKVKVLLIERKPFFLLKYKKEFYILDEEGFVLEEGNKKKLVVMEEINLKEIKVGKQVLDYRVKNAILTLKKQNLIYPEKIRKIKFVKDKIYFYTKSNVKVKFGRGENIGKKMLYLAKVLQKIKDKKVDYVTLEAEKYPAVKFKEEKTIEKTSFKQEEKSL
jgi:cell division protein FtsQ